MMQWPNTRNMVPIPETFSNCRAWKAKSTQRKHLQLLVVLLRSLENPLYITSPYFRIYSCIVSRCSILASNFLPITLTGVSSSRMSCPKECAFLDSIYIHTINLQCCFWSILSPASCLRLSNSDRTCIKRVLISSYLVSAKPSSLYHFWA